MMQDFRILIGFLAVFVNFSSLSSSIGESSLGFLVSGPPQCKLPCIFALFDLDQFWTILVHQSKTQII